MVDVTDVYGENESVQSTTVSGRSLRLTLGGFPSSVDGAAGHEFIAT